MARNIANSYRKAQINTASPGQRVVMMYEGLLRELKKAKHHMLEIDHSTQTIEKCHNSLDLCQKIILELQLALDLEKGGEIAENLNNLYDFWILELSNANSAKDAQKMSPVIQMVEELKDTWKEAAKKARQVGA
ncbi:MAG: flagellar export chaperone FliS [Lentisphaeraceae bacterium]|nr:flagellar export chaperone FliS [Lentisphaeraceae bacterium]